MLWAGLSTLLILKTLEFNSISVPIPIWIWVWVFIILGACIKGVTLLTKIIDAGKGDDDNRDRGS